MRNSARIPEVLQQLERYWQLMPDLRFGQIIRILEAEVKERRLDSFNIEDEDWQQIIQNLADEEAANPKYVHKKD